MQNAKCKMTYCPCGSPAVRLFRSYPVCAGCLVIEQGIELAELTRLQRRTAEEQAQLMQRTAEDKWQVERERRRPPEPPVPAGALFVIMGFRRYVLGVRAAAGTAALPN